MGILSMQHEERFRVRLCLEKFLYKHRKRNGLWPLLKMAESMISILRLTAINLCWAISTREKLNLFYLR